MSLSNLQRCKAWIANKPKVDEVRAKLAIVEERLKSFDKSHPKLKDIEETMQELIKQLQMFDKSASSITVNKIDLVSFNSALSFDHDSSISPIVDPLEKQSVFEQLKTQLGSANDLLKKQSPATYK